MICIHVVDDGIQIHTYHVTINGTLLMSVRASEPIGRFRRLEGKRNSLHHQDVGLKSPNQGRKARYKIKHFGPDFPADVQALTESHARMPEGRPSF